MTVSIPLPMSPQAAPGGQSATTPGKGVSKAHGPAGAPAKSGAVTEDAGSVADMFAALVATLTEQMQPATDGTESAATEASPVEVDADPALAGVVPPAVPVVVLPVTDPATVVTTATATEAAATDLVAPLPGAETTATDGDPVVDGEAAGDADHPGLGAERRATPAVRATPASHADGVKTPAQPAVPAQPAARIVGETATAVTATPGAVEESDPSITPVTTDPAARAARPDAPARVTVPAAPVRAADAHVQVARVVRPLRLGNDGAYELALDLTPAELGRVRIDVELRGSTISLSLRADNPATRDLLQQSMGQLRAELEAAGLQAGQLDVGGRGADDRGATGQGHGSDAAADSVDELHFVTPTATDLTDLDPSAGLDVRA